MELELALALPNPSPMMGKGLDLNSCSNHEMGIHETPKKRDCDFNKYSSSRSVVDEEVESKSLSLLLWSGQPNDDEDDDAPRWTNLQEENEEEDEEIMGWPPIMTSLRKELQFHRHHGGGMAAPPVRNNMQYVKVKMEGVGIGRKIDLRLYNSYQSLTHSLINMFAKYINNISNGNYTILYQDKQGDWMLAGDVPWETFIDSVQRMEILRNAS